MTTEPFHIPASTYFRLECGKLLVQMLPILLFVAMAFAVAAAFDIRMAFVGLILIFLVAPFAVFHIYFSKLLNDKAAKALALKCIALDSDSSLTVIYMQQTETDTEPQVTARHTIDSSEMTDIRLTGSYLVVCYKDDGAHTLVIPKNLLSPQDLGTILRWTDE